VRAAIILALASSLAYAQPAPQKVDAKTRAKAAAMYEKGSVHYEAGRFSEAIPLFKEAYELVHDPVYLFNLAQSYRKVLDCVNATDYYGRFLNEAGTDADAKQRERVQGWIHELAPCVEDRKRDADAAKAAQERAEAAEKARLAAEAERRRREGPKYQTIDRGKPFRITGYIAAGVGAVGMGFGLAYTLKSNRLQDELATTCMNGCDWTDPQNRQKDTDGKHANTLATVGWVTGGVLFAGGVTLYIIGRMKIEHVEVQPVEGGATVSTRLSF
jgi:tetratricopeptide (TPR) repeat protein